MKSSHGLLIIIPDMKFKCKGSVAGWSGLVSVEADSMTLNYSISFQVWRPVADRDTFDLIGSDLLVFDPMDFSVAASVGSEATNVTNDTDRGRYYYPFTRKEGKIPFQPGDVVGCHIPAGSHTSESLGFVFRSSTPQDGRDMNLTVYQVDGDNLCGAFGCDRSPIVISSVIPLIYPQFHAKTSVEYENGTRYAGGYVQRICSKVSSSCLTTSPCNGRYTYTVCIVNDSSNWN